MPRAKSYRVIDLSRSSFLTLHRPIGTFTLNRGPQVRGVVVDGWTPETAPAAEENAGTTTPNRSRGTAPDTKEVQAPPPEVF